VPANADPLARWREAFKRDNKLIVQAPGHAQKVVDLVLGTIDKEERGRAVMTHHSIDVAILFAMLGTAGFAAAWYLIGLGIGIAHRGYNRIAPYKVRRVVEPPQDPPRPTYSWKSRL
jgi:hypothetical protein